MLLYVDDTMLRNEIVKELLHMMVFGRLYMKWLVWQGSNSVRELDDPFASL